MSTPEDRVQRARLVGELEAVMNGREDGSNTPDFLLAEFLAQSLGVLDAIILAREDWYGHRHEPAQAHAYVSTACLHAICGDACRRTCKYCDAPCRHICHQDAAIVPATSWVDQARNVARELLHEHLKPLADKDIARLLDRIEHDPALFWLRGEEAPPGMGRS